MARTRGGGADTVRSDENGLIAVLAFGGVVMSLSQTLVIPLLGMLPAIEQGITTVQAKMAESPWAVFTFLVLGGFMPIPMKVFTWASGIVGVPMPQYLLSMLIGRGKRVFVLAAVIRIGGARAEAALRRWIEPLGWIATALVVVLIAWLVWRSKFA